MGKRPNRRGRRRLKKKIEPVAPDPPTMGVLSRVRPGVDLVAEEGPEGGGRVVHERNRHQRMIDWLYDQRHIDPAQYDVATELRDSWEHSKLGRTPGAGDLHRHMGDLSSSGVYLREKALVFYEGVMGGLTVEARTCLAAIVLHEESPFMWGRRHGGRDGLVALREYLDAASQIAATLIHWRDEEL